MSKFLDYTGLQHYHEKVQGQISQLGLKDAKNVPLTFTEGYMYTAAGALTANSSSKYTEKIDVSDYDRLSLTGNFSTTSSRNTLVYNGDTIVKAYKESELPLVDLDITNITHIAISCVKTVTVSLQVSKPGEIGLMRDTFAEQIAPFAARPLQWSDFLIMHCLTDGGALTTGYQMCTKPIQVVEGMTIGFAYQSKTISDTTVNYGLRVAFYSSESIDDLVKVQQKTYANIASINVPAGAKYMRISVSLGSRYTRNYWADGDITLTFSGKNTIYEDYHQFLSNLNAGEYNLSAEMKVSEFTFGSVWRHDAEKGMYVPTTTVYYYRYHYPLSIREGQLLRFEMPSFTGYLPLIQVFFCDESLDYISEAIGDTWDNIDVPAGARYAYVNVGYWSTTNHAAEEVNLNSSIFSNASPRLFYDDQNNIIALNGGESHLLNLFRNAKRALKSGTTLQTAPLTLLHFSDIHGSTDNLQRIIEVVGKYSSYIDDVVNTGDTVGNYYGDGTESILNVAGADSYLRVIGNHDVETANGTLSKVEVYNDYLASVIANWGVVQPEGAAANGYNYYYKDYTTQKVRLIVLDCMNWDTTQLSWLTTVLADANANNYGVLIAVHYPAGVLEQVDCNFASATYERIKESVAIISSAVISAVADFKTGGGEFIAFIGGHSHRDGLGLVDGNLSIVIDTANGTNTLQFGRAVAQGTRNYDCMNVIAVDRVSKMLKLFRIGADYDLNLRHIGAMAINYETHQVANTF